MSSDGPSLFPVTEAEHSNGDDSEGSDAEPFFSSLLPDNDVSGRGDEVGGGRPTRSSDSKDRTAPGNIPAGSDASQDLSSSGNSGSDGDSPPEGVANGTPSRLENLFNEDLLAPPASNAVSLPSLANADLTENVFEDAHSAINAVENAVAVQAERTKIQSLDRRLRDLQDLAQDVALARRKAAVSHRKAITAYQRACQLRNRIRSLVESIPAGFTPPKVPVLPSSLIPPSSAVPDPEGDASAAALEAPFYQSKDRDDGSMSGASQPPGASNGHVRKTSASDQLHVELPENNHSHPDSGKAGQGEDAGHEDASDAPGARPEPSSEMKQASSGRSSAAGHSVEQTDAQQPEQEMSFSAGQMPSAEANVPGKSSSSLLYGLLYSVAGTVFIAGDVVMSRELVASAFRLSGTVAPWVFAASLASLAVLLKPAYTRLVESQYWTGRTLPFKTTILTVSILAITCLGVLGVYRYQAHGNRTELRYLQQQIQEGGSDLEAIQSQIASLQQEVAQSPYGLASFALTAVLFAVSGAVALGIGIRHLRGVWHWRVMTWRRFRRLRARIQRLRGDLNSVQKDLERHNEELIRHRADLASLPSLSQVRSKAAALKSDREDARQSLELSEKAFLQEVYTSASST